LNESRFQLADRVGNELKLRNINNIELSKFMAANTYGELYRLSSFGESHGRGVGGVIDGIPPGWKLDFDEIQKELNRRKPGQSHLASPRKEQDRLEIFSGIFDGKVTGTPLAFMVWNED